MISWRRSLGMSKCRTASKFPGGPAGSNPWRSRLIWFVPRKVLNTSAIADVIVGCAPGYSGWLGVVRSGRQPVCAPDAVELADHVRRVELRDSSLLIGPRAADQGTVGLNLVEGLEPLAALKRGRRVRQELVQALQDKWAHVPHPRRLRRRERRRQSL